MGSIHREDLCDAVDSYTGKLFTHVLGWSPEECKVLQDKVKEDFYNPKYVDQRVHTYPHPRRALILVF